MTDLPPHARIARELLHGRSQATQPRVSPGARHVAHVVSTIDVDENTTRSRLWLDGGPLTDGPHDSTPRWSPDGRWLAFTRRQRGRHGAAELHVLPVDAPGEIRTLCTMPDGLDDVCWSPDGRWIAFATRTRDARYDAKDESWQSPRRIERYFARLDDEGWIVDRPRHVYVVAADGTGTARNLTPGEFQHDAPAWWPDSTGLVVSAARHDTWDTDLAVDLYAVGLDGSTRAITGRSGSYHLPSPSPDGSWVAFVGFDDPLTFPQNARVGIVRPDGSDRRWITEGLDRTFLADTCRRPPLWLDDTTILAVAEDRGRQHLYRLDLDGRDPVPVTDGPCVVVGFDEVDGTLATARTTVDRTAEVFVSRDGTTEQLTHVSAEHLGWEHFTVACADGSDEIDAWVMRPARFDPERRHPVLLNVHGGPFAQYGEAFFDEAQMQARAGFVVLMSNPRGSSGRHTGWGQAIAGPKHPAMSGTGWGSVDVDDVMTVLDHALEHFAWCDPDRVGMLGGSYGGFMATLLAARHGGRFRAVCSERSVNNLLTAEWSSDIGSAFRTEQGPDPVEDPEEYLRLSPIRLARDIEVPMLIIHSEDDWRCPISQAEELWMTLRMLGRDVTFYRFPGESHELSRTGSPVHRRMRAEIILDFFGEHLGTGPSPA